MCVTRSPSGACSVRMRATELPTVPKPTIATDKLREGVRGLANAGKSGATWSEEFKVVVWSLGKGSRRLALYGGPISAIRNSGFDCFYANSPRTPVDVRPRGRKFVYRLGKELLVQMAHRPR